MSDIGATTPRRQHPLAILRFTYRYLYLLLVPLLRGLPYITTPEGLYRWLRGTWIDLTAVFLLLLLPFLFWLRYRYTLDEHQFIIQRGILIRRTSYVPRRQVATLLIERPWYLRLFGAVRLAIETDAGNRHTADFRLTVSRRHACDLLEQQPGGAYKPLHVYRPPWRRMFLLSLLCSNSLSGVLLLAIAFNQAGVLLGEGFQDRVIGDIETVAGYVTVIPRTAALLALLVVAGWCVAAIGNVIRHAPFRAVRCADVLTIRTGSVIRRDYSCTVKSINFTDVRQTLVSRLLGLYMVFISGIGYGKVKNTMAVLIPVCRRRRAAREQYKLLPEFHKSPVELKPSKYSLYRYAFYPLWGLVLLYPLYLAVKGWLPGWRELVYHMTVMAYIPLLWLLAVKIIDRYTAGVSHRRGMLTLHYSRHFTLHTVVIPDDKVVVWQLRQSLWQKYKATCDLRVYTYNEYRVPHRVRGLPLEAALQLMNTIVTKDD